MEMNQSFPDKWCVLHSYDTLPQYSDSDVDMAFSGNNIKALESLIEKVARTTGWKVQQKFWYDVPLCFYYVLKSNNNVFLAIDFLIDNKGIGRYGFGTSLLTEGCWKYKKTIPIPNPEVAFCYKLIKRIVKKRSVEEDKIYLEEHFKRGNNRIIEDILRDQIGRSGTHLIMSKIKNNNFAFSEVELEFLNRKKRITNLRKLKAPNFFYWELIRYANRIFAPKGIIINTPDLAEETLEELRRNLAEKVDLLFRFVKVNRSGKILTETSSLIGSTLIISPKNKFNPNRILKNHWFLPEYPKMRVKEDEFADIPKVSSKYYDAILETLEFRKWQI